MMVNSEDYLKFKNGATATITQFKGMDGLIYMFGGNSCHIYSGDTESGADMEVHLYDNLHLEIYGWRKGHPKIIIRGSEFPLTLELDKESMRNIAVVTKRREE